MKKSAGFLSAKNIPHCLKLSRIHHASPMMQEITKLRDKYDLHMQVERYLSDATDASADNKFIRK